MSPALLRVGLWAYSRPVPFCNGLLCATPRTVLIAFRLPSSLQARKSCAARRLAWRQARAVELRGSGPALPFRPTRLLARQIGLVALPGAAGRSLCALLLLLLPDRLSALLVCRARSSWLRLRLGLWLCLCLCCGGLLGHTERLRVPVRVQRHEEAGEGVHQVLAPLRQGGTAVCVPVGHNVALREGGGGRSLVPTSPRPQDPEHSAEDADLEPAASGEGWS